MQKRQSIVDKRKYVRKQLIKNIMFFKLLLEVNRWNEKKLMAKNKRMIFKLNNNNNNCYCYYKR